MLFNEGDTIKLVFHEPDKDLYFEFSGEIYGSSAFKVEGIGVVESRFIFDINKKALVHYIPKHISNENNHVVMCKNNSVVYYGNIIIYEKRLPIIEKRFSRKYNLINKEIKQIIKFIPY